MDATQDHQALRILALFFGKIPQGVGKREPGIKVLFVSVFGRKQREQDFRGMGNAPLSLLKPCEGSNLLLLYSSWNAWRTSSRISKEFMAGTAVIKMDPARCTKQTEKSRITGR